MPDPTLHTHSVMMFLEGSDVSVYCTIKLNKINTKVKRKIQDMKSEIISWKRFMSDVKNFLLTF